MKRKTALKKGLEETYTPPPGADVLSIPIQPPPTVSGYDEFKKAYGLDWINIVRHPAFLAAMQLLSAKKLNSVALLSDEYIATYGKEVLSDLRGHMRHENDLLTLHEQEDFKLPFEETEEYFSPEQVAKLEEQKKQFRERNEQARYE